MSATEHDVLQVLCRIENGEITMIPALDPQRYIKSDISYHASNGWTIEVACWSGEFSGIVEVRLPDGQILDVDFLETDMPQVSTYLPDSEVAWRAYRMGTAEVGYVYMPSDEPGLFDGVDSGAVVENPERKAPYIVVNHELCDITVARWPGRLWQVQVLDRLEPQGHRGHYTRCFAVRVLTELKTQDLFGEHGEAVENVLSYAATLTLERAEQLSRHRHADAGSLQSQAWKRWLTSTQNVATVDASEMDSVLAAGNGRARSPIGHGLSLVFRGVWDAAVGQCGDSALAQDDDESCLVTPWAAAVDVMTQLFHRLLPAAVTTSVFAALAHALLVAIAARSFGLELLYIASLSFVIALFVALLGGALLLAVVAALRLKLISSFLLFLFVVQGVAIGLEMYFFEIGLRDMSWRYGLISVPASVIAWRSSVFQVHRSS